MNVRSIYLFTVITLVVTFSGTAQVHLDDAEALIE
jgi:hypothetical protein